MIPPVVESQSTITNHQSSICTHMDLYLVLGLEREATVGDIKRAYRRLARRFHPDINSGDRRAALQFGQIAEAYETLSDPERRRRHDATGAAGGAQKTSAYGFEGSDVSDTHT